MLEDWLNYVRNIRKNGDLSSTSKLHGFSSITMSITTILHLSGFIRFLNYATQSTQFWTVAPVEKVIQSHPMQSRIRYDLLDANIMFAKKFERPVHCHPHCGRNKIFIDQTDDNTLKMLIVRRFGDQRHHQ